MGYIVRNSPKFDPRHLGGLALWLKADVGVTLSLGVVAQWDDQSGNNNHAIGTLLSQPSLVQGAINRRPVIRFNGSTKLSVPDHVSLQNQNGSMFVVVNCPSLHTHYLIGNEDFNVDRYGCMMWGNNSQLNGEIGNASTFQVKSTNLLYGDNIPHILGVIYSSTELQCWMDGLVFITPTSRSITMAWNGYTFNIGNTPNGGTNRFYTGDIAEILYFNFALNDQQRFAVQRYLNSKYKTF